MQDVDKSKEALLAELNVLRKRLAQMEKSVAAHTEELEAANHELRLKISERKRVEEALRRSQNRLESAQAQAKLGSWEFYPETNTSYWSKEMFRLYGRDTALGHPTLNEFLSLIHPDDRQRVRNSQAQSLTTEDMVSIEYRTNPACGPVKHLQATVHSIQRKDGQPLFLAGTVIDITERKHNDEVRERLIAELELKNAELERFTYTVSHDLKSPLVTIKGFLGLLERDLHARDHERVKQDVRQISTAADQMYRMLHELLELSRIGRLANPPEAIPLDMLVAEGARLVAGPIMAYDVALDIAPGLPVVVGDRIRLLEVLQNLIDNAVKFMGDQPNPHIEIGGWLADDEAVCFVRDNGMGIESRYHEKIFGLFERLDTDHEGTGIGLALAQRIIEIHGGRIWVESKGLGHGSTFYFTLPAV